MTKDLRAIPKPEDRRAAPIISWMIPIPDETADEFAAFQSWIAAGDEAMPLDVLKKHDLPAETADRNGWVERREHRFSHERLIKTRIIQRMQMQQIEWLRSMQVYYQQEIEAHQEELKRQRAGKIESTARSIKLLREAIAEGLHEVKRIIDATARIHSSLDTRGGLTINTSSNTKVMASANNEMTPPDENPVALIYRQMAAFGRPPEQIEGEVIDQDSGDSAIDSMT